MWMLEECHQILDDTAMWVQIDTEPFNLEVARVSVDLVLHKKSSDTRFWVALEFHWHSNSSDNGFWETLLINS